MLNNLKKINKQKSIQIINVRNKSQELFFIFLGGIEFK